MIGGQAQSLWEGTRMSIGWWASWIVVAALALLALLGALLWRWGYRAGRGTASRDRPDRPYGGPSMFGAQYSANDVERGLMEIMQGVVIITDAQGHVRYASSSAMQLGLVESDRLQGRGIGEMLTNTAADGHVRNRELELPYDPVSDSPRNDQGHGRGVKAGELSTMGARYLHVRIGRIAEGLFALVVQDVSERRHFEHMRRDFVTNVSHELKTPAGAISLLAETLVDAADDPKAVRYFSGRISKESARLTELVLRLIDLQKAQGDVMSLDAERVPVMDVVREAVRDNQVQASSTQIAVQISLHGRRVPSSAGLSSDADEEAAMVVFANRDALKTAVRNLVENALRYSPPRTTVGIGVGAVNGNVVIRVVDQGIGIPADSLDRIFERFYRVDPARSRATGGTGLGLSIAKHSVEECGGTISVWSRPGEGSTFTIKLPLTQATVGGASAGGSPPGD